MAKTTAPSLQPSLVEFAKEHPTGQRKCLLCTVPASVEQQAQAGKAAGITYKTIGEWLAQLGYADPDKPPTQARLQRHFQDGHGQKRSFE